MKKILSFGLLFLLVMTLSGCLDLYRAADTNVTASDFCIKYPSTLACTNPDASEEAIINDIFAIALVELKKSDTSDFCDNFFNSEHVDLMNKCKTEAEKLIPEDIDDLSDVFELVNLDGTNEYRATVDYNDGSEGYVFNFSVVEEDGKYKIDSFSFESMESLYALTASEIEDRYVEFFADLLDYTFSKGGLISDYFLDGYPAYLLDGYIDDTRFMIKEIVVNDLEYISYFDGTYTIVLDYTFIYKDDNHIANNVVTLPIHVVGGEIKIYPVMVGSQILSYYANYDEVNELVNDMLFEFYDESLDCEKRFTENALDSSTICSSGTAQSFFPSGTYDSYFLREVGKGGFLLTIDYYDEESSTMITETKYIVTAMGDYGVSISYINDYSYFVNFVISGYMDIFIVDLVNKDMTNVTFCTKYQIANCDSYRDTITSNNYVLHYGEIYEVATYTSSYTEVVVYDSGDGERIFEIWLEYANVYALEFYIK